MNGCSTRFDHSNYSNALLFAVNRYAFILLRRPLLRLHSFVQLEQQASSARAQATSNGATVVE